MSQRTDGAAAVGEAPQVKLLAALTSTLILASAGHARAATPSSGTVSPSSPRTGWTGTVAGHLGIAYDHAETTGGVCEAPLCDTFRLDVSGSGGRLPLTVVAAATTAAQEVTIEIEQPDGSRSYAGSFDSPSPTRELTVPAAPDGAYVVRVAGGSLDGSEWDYEAKARLGAAEPSECRVLQAFGYETGGAPIAGSPANDPLYKTLHGHRQMHVPEAWARGGRGQGATIAILDSGVDSDHPDLRANLVPGVDMVEGEYGDCAPGPRDVSGHGTHVAGLAAAVADNGIGVAGVAPRARIMPVRVCGIDFCSPEAINDGIRWASDHGADVINLSLALGAVGAVLDPRLFAEAVGYARDRGAVVVAAAGNATLPFCSRPAADAGALCVGAVDRDGVPTRYSNLPADPDGDPAAVRAFGGDGSTCETLAISTAWPGADPNECGRAYAGYQGTSMAAPHVAGAAAVLRSFGVPAAEVAARLMQTASNGGRYDPVMGYGIPDLAAATRGLTAVAEAAAPPPGGAPPAGPGRAGPRPAPGTSDRRRCSRARARLRKASRELRRARRHGGRRAVRRAASERRAARRAVVRRCR